MPKGLPKVHAPWRPGPELQSVLHRLGLGDESLHAIRLHSEIGDIGMRALSAILHGSSPNLSEVYLSGNNIGDEGAILFADALRTNTYILKVHLGRNCIGNEGARALAAAMRENSTVRELILYDNQLGDAALEAMADMLRSNRTLEVLNLAQNPRMTEDGWDHVIDVVDSPQVVRAWRLRVLEGVDLAMHHEQLKLPGRLSNTMISAAVKPVKKRRGSDYLRTIMKRANAGAKMAVSMGMTTDLRARQAADTRRNVDILEYMKEQAEVRAKEEEEKEALRAKEEGEDWD